MTVVGSAEIMVRANTKAFAGEVEAQTKPAFAEVEREAEVAGQRSGAAMAAGVRKGSSAMAAESKAAGVAAGAGMAKPVEDGAKRSEVAMVTAATRGHKAFLGATVAVAGTAFEGLHLAESMQSTEAAIAGAAGTSVKAARQVGDALLGTAGKSEFSGEKMAEAYSKVAGQLKTTEGRALTAGQAEHFMSAASELATAKQIDLGVAASATAAVMQAFGLHTRDAAHVTDVLYQASNATGQGVDTLGTKLAQMRSRLGASAGSVGDLAGLLVDMTAHGVQGRNALSGLSAGLQTLTSASEKGTPAQKKTAEAMRILGVQAFDSHGKFVGMASIIAQLHPKLQGLTEQQQKAATSMLFTGNAQKAMLALINAGPAAFARATSAVSKHGAASDAAAKQSRTMHGELHTLGAAATDLATGFGQVLVPAVTGVVHTLVSATHFVLQHKTAAEALAAVITGVLGVAIGAFAVNKMAGMIKSVRTAGSELKAFGTVSANVAKRVAGSFALQGSAAEGAAGKIEASQATERATVRTTATTIQAENTATSRSFTLVGTSAGLGASAVEGKVAAEAGAVATADTAIEATNATAGASFTAMLGPMGLVLAAAYAIQQALHPGGDINTFIASAKAKIAAAGAGFSALGDGIAAATTDPRLSNYPDSHPVATGHVSMPATVGGLTAKQRRQLAALQTGGGSSSSGGGSSGGGSSSSHATSYTRTTFAEAVLRGLGAPVTHANVAGIIGWENAEGGQWSNSASFNPLNTTLNMPGAHSINSVGVKAYGSWAQGLAATLKTLHGYGAITDILKAGQGGQRLASAIGSSPWGTSASLVSSTIAHAVVGHLTGAVAKTVQADPTRWARAMIGHFAESTGSNTGPELDKLQAEFHTRAAAWCAEFATTAAVMGGAHKAVRTAAVRVVGAWAQAGTHGYEKGIKTHARAGDLALLQGASGHWGHMGIVESVNAARGTFTTIEGNTSAGRVVRRTHLMSDSEGFARPIYPAGSVAGTGAPGLTHDQKQLIATEKLVSGQQAAFNKWLNDSNAQRSLMTGAQQRELDQEIVIKRSALEIQTTREFAALTTQTRQQKTHLTQMAGDQKLAAAMTTKLVAATHSGNLKQLTTILAQTHAVGLGSLVKRLSGDHITGFAALAKQLVAVHAAALAQQGKELAAATVKAVQTAADKAAAAIKAVDQANAARITAGIQTADDTNAANVQDIQDRTKVTLDRQAEIGKTGADLIAAQAQTALDMVVQSTDATIGAAQLAVDKAAGDTSLYAQTNQAIAASRLAAAHRDAQLQQAQAQATLDLDTAAAQAADAATSAADAAAAAAASSSTPVGDAGLPPNFTFDFTINGANMTAADLFSEVGWALKTGSLPVAAPAAS